MTRTTSLDRRKERAEVGGEFDRSDLPVGASAPLPSPRRLYSIATHAMLGAWASLDRPSTRRLHVPDYFCPEVTDAWQAAGISLVPFADDPRWPAPDWSSLDPAPGDVVLAVDFFGVRDGAGWTRWRRRHPDVLLVEDHSHDPGSAWARHSIADFAFASLRKTLPVSDGAILWSPSGRPLPDPLAGPPAGGSAVKLAAMVLKREYLAGKDVTHDAFRTLQLRGERELLADPPSPMAPWNQPFADAGLSVHWRRRRARNVRLAISLLRDTSRSRPMFDDWPRGHCPFNLVLLFDDEATRDACRTALLAQRIYPPVHWGQPSSAAARVRDLASRILTVPLDHRYGRPDVERVVNVLRAFDAAS